MNQAQNFNLWIEILKKLQQTTPQEWYVEDVKNCVFTLTKDKVKIAIQFDLNQYYNDPTQKPVIIITYQGMPLTLDKGNSVASNYLQELSTKLFLFFNDTTQLLQEIISII